MVPTGSSSKQPLLLHKAGGTHLHGRLHCGRLLHCRRMVVRLLLLRLYAGAYVAVVLEAVGNCMTRRSPHYRRHTLMHLHTHKRIGLCLGRA